MTDDLTPDDPPQAAVAPLVTKERLDLSLIFPDDRSLGLPVMGTRDEETGRVPVRDYVVRGRLTVDDMARLLDLERKLDLSLTSRRDLQTRARTAADAVSLEAELSIAEREVIEAVIAGNDCIRQILVARNENVPEELGLDEEAVMVTMSWLVGDVSVADAVARAITSGMEGARSEEEILAEAARRVAAGEADSPDVQDPSPSPAS